MEEQKLKDIINILYIKNFIQGNNVEYLNENPNINIKFIQSIELIGLDMEKLIELIEPFTIIILGGGTQHLTTNNLHEIYPEIQNQIQIVKLIKTKYFATDKILIGLCLGCQIIGLSFEHKIIPMEKMIVGFNQLDANSVNWNWIYETNNNYLSSIDYKLISQAFSFHSDCIDPDSIVKSSSNTELKIIAYSINNIPYIVANSDGNIFGFQSHPEFCFKTLSNIIEMFFCDESQIMFQITNSKNLLELEKINKHFFDIFINKKN